jgi:toxin YhaV
MNDPLVINGWVILAHPLFLHQLELLISEVEEMQVKDPINFRSKKSTKKLAAIKLLALEKIPADPTLIDYRQGTTLGDENKHWFRAKFFQQYRLFFSWVNDEDTKRAYDKKSDAYKVFKKMLKSGKPPNNWDSLQNEAKGLRFQLS